MGRRRVAVSRLLRGPWPVKAALAAQAALLLAGLPAHAHDSWLVPGPLVSPRTAARQPDPAAKLAVGLSTGNRYPVADLGPPPESVLQARCRGADGREAPLRARGVEGKALLLEAALPLSARGATACWVELKALDIEIAPALVEVYFNEIRPTPASREAWAGLRARGLPWRERYRKFARIEWTNEAAAPSQIAQARRPAGLGLELVVLGDKPLAVGEETRFQLLRDGVPLPDFPLELVSERSPLGVWRNTDAEGRLAHVLPFAGRWLLRGTELRLADEPADTWQSRFVTLSFEARAR